jgi:hypothetical protein
MLVTFCTILRLLLQWHLPHISSYRTTDPGEFGNKSPFALLLSLDRGPGKTCQKRRVSSPAPLSITKQNIEKIVSETHYFHIYYESMKKNLRDNSRSVW